MLQESPCDDGISLRDTEIQSLAREIISAAEDVHRFLGPGVLEYPYQIFMKRELESRGLAADSKVPVRIEFEGNVVESGLELDLVVEDSIIVELKCVAEITALHRQELYTYLKLARKPLGLLVNFSGETLQTLAVQVEA